MAKKSKSTFNESFKEGMGGEMGKRTGTILFGLIVLFVLTVFGIKSCDSPTSNDQSTPTIDKTHSKPSNSQ